MSELKLRPPVPSTFSAACEVVPSRLRKTNLHRDGVFCVAGDIPAGTIAALGEQGARAGHVFFGLLSVNLIFHAVSFVGDSQEAYAMNTGSGGAKARLPGTQREPQEIPNKKKK
jgi:hypothetical protein